MRTNAQTPAPARMTKRAILDLARTHNACKEGIAAFRAWRGDYDSFAAAHPAYALWLHQFAPHLLTPERLDACAAFAAPCAALVYAAPLLTPERLDACAAAAPWTALKYAAHLLTPARLDACAKAEPRTALEHAAHLITPERLDMCAAAEPVLALMLAANRLTQARVEWCRAQAKGMPK
jgi:hypothetical protein